MHLTRVKLYNVGPHEEFEATFGLGLTGVFGPNGSGKSTIFSAAYAAITGDYSRFDTKERMVRAGAARKAFSGIEVEFVDRGRTFRILRSLSAADCTLKVDGEQVAGNSKETAKALVEQYGFDFHLLGNYAFIEQEEISSLLKADPAERAKAFQRLCGTSVAARVMKSLDAAIANTEASLEPTVDVERLESRADELRRRVSELDEQVAETEKSLPADETVAAWRASEATAARRKALAKTIDDERQKRREAKAEIDVLDQDLKVADAKLAEIGELDESEVDAAVDKHRRLEAAAAAWKRRQSIASALAALNAAAGENDAVVVAKPKGFRPSVEVAEDLGAWTSRLREISASLDALLDRKGAASCPTCLKPFTDEDVKTLQAQENEAKRLKQQFSDESKASKEYEQKAAAKDRESVRIANELRILNRDFEEYAFSSEVNRADVDKAEDELTALRNRLRDKRKWEVVQRGAESKRATFVKQWDDAKQRGDAAQVELDSLPEVDENVSDRLRKYDAAQAKLGEDKGARKAHQQNLDRTLEDLALSRRKTALSAKRAKMLLYERDARNRSHHKGLPQTVTVGNLRRMTDAVNEFLEAMGAEFWLRIEDDMSFSAVFPNGEVIFAGQLSVGLKAILSICLRRAIGDLFGHTGPIFLDEPTAALDGRYISSLRDFLSRLASDVRGNRQIVVITHADQLRSCFERVIDLGEGVRHAA